MKKLFALIFVLGLSLGIRAQNYVLNEDFSSSFPPAGWSISAHAANWSAVNSANAGGTPKEVRFVWSPQFNGETRLITKTLDVSDNTSGILSFSFKHKLENYSGNYQIGVSARAKESEWVLLWSQEVTASIPAQTKVIQIDNPDFVNASDIQLSFFFKGPSYNIDNWYIDDVQLVMPANFDLGITKIDLPTHFMDPIPLKGSVTCLGIEEITSFDLNWQIDDEPVHTQSFSNISIKYYESYNFQIDELIDLEPGTYTLTVNLSNINGEEEDDYPENNEFSTRMYVAHQAVQRIPLFESFTSSTCPPCATFNRNFFNNFTQQNENELALIKYQMNWPGSGDPYYTLEGGVRRNYYGVGGVPFLVLEGGEIQPSSTAVNSGFQNAKQIPSYMAIEGFHLTDGNNIIVEASILPYADFPNVTVHVVVVEGTTTGNIGGNGETFFKHVMMKMLPNAGGTTVDLTALEPYIISYNFDMSNTHVEEMEDLKVIIFVQEDSTRRVFQAHTATYQGNPPVSPEVMVNLEDGETNVSLEPEIIVCFDQPVRHADGREITPQTISEILHLKETDENGDDVEFTATINEEKTEITLQPVEPLAEEQLYYFRVDPVSEYSDNMLLSEVVEITFTTLSTVFVDTPVLDRIMAYPNPANDILQIFIPKQGYTELRILDIRGNIVVEASGTGSKFRMDVTSLPAGIYFLEIRNAKNRMVEIISIVH